MSTGTLGQHSVVELAQQLDEGELTREDVGTELHERFENEPERRIEAILEGALDRVDAHRSVPNTTQPRSADQRPYEGSSRRLDVADVAELSDREFGRLFGFVLRRFGGSVTVETGEALEDATVVYWSRGDNENVMAVVLARRPSEKVTGKQLKELSEALSIVASESTDTVLVTNLSIEPSAAEQGTSAGLTICDQRHLDGLLSLARLPPKVYGELLEKGENTTFDQDALIASLPAPPVQLDQINPFDPSTVRRRSPAGIGDSGSDEAHDGDTESVAEVGTGSVTAKSETETETSTSSAQSSDTAISPQGEETVHVDEEQLGELQTDESDDTDTAIGSLVENLGANDD